MIRVVVEAGRLRPIDPLPEGWSEGRLLRVEAVGDDPGTGDLDDWAAELQRLGPALYEPGEREEVRAILDEADALAKAEVRRMMGLP